MNDLDRDLRELFHDKAGSIDAAPAAPTDVLRRGRRRQIRTVFASSLAAVAALAIVVAVAARLTGGPNQIPVTNAPYGERIATIHGITVTAPEGWTLIDDWPVASLLPTTSQTCSFAATGSPIGPSPAGGSTSSEPAVQPSSSCTTEPMPLPAGIPVLQLANFELPLDGTVCQVGDLRSVDLPADGVAAYVAAFPQGMTTDDFLAACPGGATVTTFADGGSTSTYAAVSLIGPDASPGDVAAVERFMNSLGGLRVTNDEPTTASPGYVVAAGVDGGTAWRLEAGFPFRGSGSGIGATLVVTDAEGHETASSPVPPAQPKGEPTERTERLADGSGWLAWGTSSRLVSAMTSVAPDGTRTPATLLPWPDGMRSLVRTDEATQLDGSIWYAIVPQLGPMQVSGDSSLAAAPEPLAVTALPYRVEGSATVANGSDLGHAWQFRAQGNTLDLRVDGSDAGGFTGAGSGQTACGRVDVSGGTFLLCEETADVSYVRVTADVSGEQPVADGRWMPAGDPADGRAWIVALPGEGTGYQTGSGGHPLAISWPSRAVPQPGDVTSAGMTGAISWAIRWTDQACPVMDVVFSRVGDTGTSSCLIPWDGSDPAVGGVYGQREATIILTGPETMSCDLHDPSGSVPGVISGGTIAPVDGWSHTGQCVFTIPVGHTVRVLLTDPQGNPILGRRGQVTITADRGSLTLGSPAAAP
jgi:hypothetical protein